jgi:hypothetical protein
MATRTAKPLTSTQPSPTKARKSSATKSGSTQVPSTSGVAQKRPRIFAISFASVYPLYVQKAEKKGRTEGEVGALISWLTGYSSEQLQLAIDSKVDFETFFAQAPQLNPNMRLITGVVCGVRVEDVADPLMQKIRYLDKLIDELAKGKKMASILRE